MIRRLRIRHRRIWTLLAVLVPILLALALHLRPEPPRPRAHPDLSDTRQAQIGPPLEEAR